MLKRWHWSCLEQCSGTPECLNGFFLNSCDIAKYQHKEKLFSKGKSVSVQEKSCSLTLKRANTSMAFT